ncbi:monovalent cation/H+ antiporter subunit D [Sphingomonas sp. ac-8]|uniref:monovalent cation/H+ antiporter subunit D n=1 Tax=Sphingomonas sp. ac-8 TaxID=3242977 RepID=UPI003A80D02E
MTDWIDHLIVAPILLPLIASAAMLLFDERRRPLKRILSFATSGLLIAVAILLLISVSGADGTGARVYHMGGWPAPFGIVLVADRLSTLMVLLASGLGFTSLLYALARWDRLGPRFHPLFLLLLAGVNGAFLTGDVFNLFVFFEVLLAASYGLVLHGAGPRRTTASLHYIAINVATSLLFLIGVSMIYSVTGTLNMADLAVRVPQVPAADLAILEAGAAILGTAFLVKAGIWPLSFWLPTTYAAAAPPVAAAFAIMSKVGVYVVLRLYSLLFGVSAGDAAGFAGDALLWAGMATIAFGTIGILASRTLTRIAGYYILVSSGTLIAAIGTGRAGVIAGALLYLVSSTLAVSAFYLIIEPVERNAEEEQIFAAEPVFDDEYTGALPDEENEVGIVIPGTIALLGGGFIFCALLLAGLPPLSGFIAKFAIIAALLQGEGVVDASVWVLIALIILSGLAALVSLSRAGIDLLWTPSARPLPQLRALEATPIGLLLALCLGLMIGAGPILRYMNATAAALAAPADYLVATGIVP